ncbi:hypothetical protein GGS23DRAFT_99536 [Durotheca rogersii]|uniref:uncharacterized protein n=1 Tax=Durotheca rogersii TaxID=419775 RepID=UPI00222103CE|nr:uncharacterized protein GGS23DRAFT_99536 [Durotheca rogersii]KAI5862418.1 hypothetical protein GGS23DRAFT_99536 [Durotheca rogersii]
MCARAEWQLVATSLCRHARARAKHSSRRPKSPRRRTMLFTSSPCPFVTCATPAPPPSSSVSAKLASSQSAERRLPRACRGSEYAREGSPRHVTKETSEVEKESKMSHFRIICTSRIASPPRRCQCWWRGNPVSRLVLSCRRHSARDDDGGGGGGCHNEREEVKEEEKKSEKPLGSVVLVREKEREKASRLSCPVLSSLI